MSDAAEPADRTHEPIAEPAAEPVDADPIAYGADTADSGPGSVAQDRAREGLEHLQTAAHELIAAARAALDVAEDLIDDPDTISSVVGAAGSLGGLGDLVRSLLSTRRDTPSGGGAAADDPDADGSSTIQRIKIV